MSGPRHRWGEPVRFPHKSERQCIKCGLVKVTRHEAEGPRDVHWVEYWREGDQVAADKTPACEPVKELVAA